MGLQEHPQLLSAPGKVTKVVHKHGSEPLPIFIFPLFAIGLNPAESDDAKYSSPHSEAGSGFWDL